MDERRFQRPVEINKDELLSLAKGAISILKIRYSDTPWKITDLEEIVAEENESYEFTRQKALAIINLLEHNNLLEPVESTGDKLYKFKPAAVGSTQKLALPVKDTRTNNFGKTAGGISFVSGELARVEKNKKVQEKIDNQLDEQIAKGDKINEPRRGIDDSFTTKAKKVIEKERNKVLDNLGILEEGTSISTTELSKKIGMSSGKVGGNLNFLKKLGLIKRLPSAGKDMPATYQIIKQPSETKKEE